MQDLAGDMGEGYGVGEIVNYYEFVGSDAVSLMEGKGLVVDGDRTRVPRTVPISELVAEIEGALSR